MLVKLSIPEAKNLRPGQILLWMGGKNSDGSFMRYKVNGQVKTWVTRPEQFKIPVKRGLYEFAYVTEKEIDQFRLEI